jgi:hypothetical protein
MGKKEFIDDGKAVSRKVSVILPYEKDNAHQMGKFEWAGLYLYNVRVVGYPKPIAMAFKKDDAPMAGDDIEIAICVEDEKWHKGYLPEQLEKAKSGGGGGGKSYSPPNYRALAFPQVFAAILAKMELEGNPVTSVKSVAELTKIALTYMEV